LLYESRNGSVFQEGSTYCFVATSSGVTGAVTQIIFIPVAVLRFEAILTFRYCAHG
jgi:hypothetical protein